LFIQPSSYNSEFRTLWPIFILFYTVILQFLESGVIVGIDLSGDPSVDGRHFIPVLQQARAAGLKVSVHLAEVLSGLKEVDEFLVFRPDRIGHGTYLHTDETFVVQVVSQRIPLGLKKFFCLIECF
ncbi:hypothetical protein GCK32_022472, partial [Trichostrongylus colubriformis]